MSFGSARSSHGRTGYPYTSVVLRCTNRSTVPAWCAASTRLRQPVTLACSNSSHGPQSADLPAQL